MNHRERKPRIYPRGYINGTPPAMGEIMAAYRVRYGQKQTIIAEVLRVSRARVSQLEGEEDISNTRLHTVANHYGVSFEEFVLTPPQTVKDWLSEDPNPRGRQRLSNQKNH